ncbi:MAG: reverse transcriptase domain-containing protein, partial [Bacteroidota bacterium]
HVIPLCEKYGIEIELTAPYTPQLNGVAERGFAVVKMRAMAMLEKAGLTDKMKDKLWAEAVNTATYISNIVPTSANEDSKCPDEVFYGEQPKGYKYLHPFGQVGYVTKRGKHIKKFERRSTKMIMVGYALTSARDTYRLYNPSTNSVIESRDVSWADWHGSKQSDNPTTDMEAFREIKLKTNDLSGEDGNEDGVGIGDEIIQLDEENFQPKVHTPPAAAPSPSPPSTPTNQPTGNDNKRATPIQEVPRVEEAQVEGENLNPAFDAVASPDSIPSPGPYLSSPTESELNLSSDSERAMFANNRFAAFMREHDEEANREDMQDVVEKIHKAYVAVHHKDEDDDTPRTYEEAVNGPDKEEWQKAIKKEVDQFRRLGVFEFKCQKRVKELMKIHGKKAIKAKWLFKWKHPSPTERMAKARCVAKGFTQVIGIDYTESFAPVVNDVTTRTVMVYGVKRNYISVLYDHDAAFLNGILDELLFLEIPEGFGAPPGTIVILRRSMYGLVQAARAWKTTKDALMKKHGFTKSKTDPCLFFKRINVIDLLMTTVYVDDCIANGPSDNVETFLDDLDEDSEYKFLGQVNKYSGGDYEIDVEKKKITVKQTELIDSMTSQVECFEATTPSLSSVPMKKNEKSPMEPSKYRSLVGKALYLNKISRPDISNQVRELSQHFDNPGVAQWKQLLRLISYLGETRDMGLVMNVDDSDKEHCRIESFVDSDFATDPDCRRSVTGYLVFVDGALVAWKSKRQGATTLSST